MPPTTIRGKQVLDGSIQRTDLDISTTGQAVVAKLVQGTNITLSSTGVDSGTGDVTINGPSSMTPTAHALTHKSGGTDAIKLDELAAPTDVTTLNASTTAHGLLPKVPGTTTTFLRGDATFATPTGIVPSVHASTHVTGGSDVIALATGSNAGLLRAPSALSTDVLVGTHAWSDLATAVTPTITSVRLRSTNSIGNSNFEITQRDVKVLQNITPSASPWACDRWWTWLSGTVAPTLRFSTQVTAGNIAIPGTSYLISQNFLRITLTTAQASLGTDTIMAFGQTVEGPVLRSLFNDVHSGQMLVRSSVANLKFGMALSSTDSPATRTLCKVYTLGAANTWTLAQWPNMSSFVGAGGAGFPLTPGSPGYNWEVFLAAGTAPQVPANDVWQTSTATTNWAPNGIQNFAASAVNSTFDIAYVGHEPGPLCTTPQDLSLGANLDGPMGCTRYYQKSYPIGTAPGTIAGGNTGVRRGTVFFTNATLILASDVFPKRMAKAPTVVIYNPNTGTINNCIVNAANVAVSAVTAGETSIDSITVPSQSLTTGQSVNGSYHYTADAGF